MIGAEGVTCTDLAEELVALQRAEPGDPGGHVLVAAAGLTCLACGTWARIAVQCLRMAGGAVIAWAVYKLWPKHPEIFLNGTNGSPLP